MSSLLNSIIVLLLLLSKNFAMMENPIKNEINPISNVTAKLEVIEFIDSNKKIENNKITTNGLKTWFLMI